MDAMLAVDTISGVLLAIGLLIAVIVLFFFLGFVVLPFLGIVLEVSVLVVLAGAGVIGKVVFRRPWTVEVVNLDDPHASQNFEVVGWLRSRRAIAELKGSILATGRPSYAE